MLDAFAGCLANAAAMAASKKGDAPEGDGEGSPKRPRMVAYAPKALIEQLDACARSEGLELGPWLVALAKKRMRHVNSGGKKFDELRREREAIIKRVRDLFNVIEEEEDAEDIAAADADD